MKTEVWPEEHGTMIFKPQFLEQVLPPPHQVGMFIMTLHRFGVTTAFRGLSLAPVMPTRGHVIFRWVGVLMIHALLFFFFWGHMLFD